jgi:type II secretory pathway component GspD/PulD (secretin)
MQYRLKLWCALLGAAMCALAGDAYGRGNTELRMIKITQGSGASICATAKAALSPDGRMSFDDKTNTLVVADRPDYLPHIEELVRTLDIKIPQVEISVRIAEVTGRFLQEAGINSGQVIFPRDSFTPVRGLLNARTGSSTRSEMTLTTPSGVPAQLQVRREAVFGSAEAKDDPGRKAVAVQKKDAGEFLEILPMANYDNTVTVKVRPSPSRAGSGGGVSESAVLTQVTLHSGDTVAIGSAAVKGNDQRKILMFLSARIMY